MSKALSLNSISNSRHPDSGERPRAASPSQPLSSLQPRPPAAANPFASLAAPAGRTIAFSTGAETKAYQVPRELIEIARARVNVCPSNALTPLAPRPDQGIEATVLANAAAVSASTVREQPVLAESAEPSVAHEPSGDEPMLEVTSDAEAAVEGAEVVYGSDIAPSLDAAQPLELRRRIRANDVAFDLTLAEPDEPPSSRAWLYYAAGLSLVGAATLALLT
jgi:hypothetical protein